MENAELTGTWTKNAYGQWSVRVKATEKPTPGQIVQVVKKSGEKQKRYVSRVDFAEKDGFVCAVTENPPLPEGWRRDTFSVGFIEIGQKRYFGDKNKRENWFLCEAIAVSKELDHDDDWKTVEVATLRPLTDDEYSEVLSRIAEAGVAKRDRDSVFAIFSEKGEKKETETLPENAKKIFGGNSYDDERIYDCGEYLLKFNYNNRDGDDWSLNNSAGGVLLRLSSDLDLVRDLCRNISESAK